MGQDKWNDKYQTSTLVGTACYTLRSHKQLLPATGQALDLACGLGANGMYLAQAGLSVDAWDYSRIALEKLQKQSKQLNLDIQVSWVDLEQNPDSALLSQKHQYDVICVSNYLYRPIFKSLVEMLKPQGLLLYETFYHPNNSGTGPSQQRFLLKQQELNTLLPTLTVITYQHSSSQATQTPANKVFYCARKG